MKARTFVTDDGRVSDSRYDKELTEEYKDNTQAGPQGKHGKDEGEVVCYMCAQGGKLLCCCGKGCQIKYHPSCMDPPLKFIPIGFWHCIQCVRKKIKLGVHSVSEGVESILDSREVVSKDEVMQRDYFVKYQGLAHAHNRWIPEKKMVVEAPKLLEKYKKKQQVVRWKKDWSIPQRLLLKRKIILSKQNTHPFDEYDSLCRYEWLVKWTGLGYDHVTWELDDAPFMTSSQGIKLKDNYESPQKRLDGLSIPFEVNEERKVSFTELSALTSSGSSGLSIQHLNYVNSLRMCWHKGQSAVIVDDQIDQERVRKMILFILSLNRNVKRPFLIISTSTGLSAWETEFLHLAPSANLVVYKGNKDVRSSIRALEFYNEDGDISFQILLSSSDMIIEDLHTLRNIPWETIIIDECQRPRILGHIDNVNILAAERRLLLVSGQIKEDRADYVKLLSFLDSRHDELHFSSASISNLKGQLEQYIAFKYNSDSGRFREYWVPAQLSWLQLEQYCSMLLSNSISLCSGQKYDSFDALRDLIISTRKCCNHPYLLDPSLNNVVTRGLPVEEHFNVGIKTSGKLQLLETILSEVKSCGLRAMILFQSSVGSGSIGDILDDVLCHRFGKDSYVRYARGYLPSKKQAALDTFNDRDSGKFVFLVESRACLPSIKLSFVDTIILFDSDLDPQNDLKCLQKMSISSKFEQLTVLRLYSYFTVEEKILMLAKEGIALDSNMQLVNQSTTYHTLLKWGASYLFSKLDDLHGNGTSVSASDISEQSILNDVTCELSSKLVCDSNDTDCHGQSFISRVQQNGGKYTTNISLLGERDVGNETNTFSWSDLLKGRYPLWKFLPVSSQRIRKTAGYFHEIQKEPEYENEARKMTESKENGYPIRKRVSKDNVAPEWKVTKDNVDPKRRKVCKDIVDTKRTEFSKGVADPKTRKVARDVIDTERRDLSKKIVDSKGSKVSMDVGSKYLKRKWKNKKNRSANKRKRKLNGNRIGFSNVFDSIRHPLINEMRRAAVMNKSILKQKKLPDTPKSTKLLSKPDISGLCDVLCFSKNVEAVAMRILEHVYKKYDINCRDVTTVQAFELSVCWLAASLLKHKINRELSLDLAQWHLNFKCKGEEVTNVYNVLQKYDKEFSSCLQNELCVEESNINGGSGSLTPEMTDLVEEEKKKGFQRPQDLNLMKCSTNEHDLPRKSPTTVLPSKDQIYTENFHNEPYIAHEIFTPQKTPGSLPVESDATSMESDADERINAMTTVTTEVSSLEHWNEALNSSNDFHNVNPVTGSLERQSPIVSSEFMKSYDDALEDPQTLMNQVIDFDNSMNMSTHLAQLHNTERDAVTCDRTDVPEISQRYSIVSHSELAECSLPYIQLPHASLMSLPQASLSASPSFSEELSRAVRPLDRFGYQNDQDRCFIREAEEMLQSLVEPVELVSPSAVSPAASQPSTYVPRNENATHAPHSQDHCYIREAEEMLQPLMEPVELVSPSFVSPAASQPSTYVPRNENATHAPHGQDHWYIREVEEMLQSLMEPVELVSPSFVSPVASQPSTYVPRNENATHLMSEMAHAAEPDPLLIEMERTRKISEEAVETHKKKILQLQSDYQKEFEMLCEKHSMLLQNVNTAVELKNKELATQHNIAFMHGLLAEAWIRSDSF